MTSCKRSLQNLARFFGSTAAPVILLILVVLKTSACSAALSYNQPQSLQQSMAQLLQVFNGNETAGQQHSDTNHFKLLERQGDFLLVGAR